MSNVLISALIALALLLVGGSGIETALLTGDDLLTKIAMPVLFSPFIILGLVFAINTANNTRDYINGTDKVANIAFTVYTI